MSKTRPRQEFQFSTSKDRPDLDYVPVKSRNPWRIELFSGKPPGSVIAIQQRVGIEALSVVYEKMDRISGYGVEDLRAVSDITALTALGTAHHAFAEPEAENLSFRRIKLARVLDPDTKERLTPSKLVGSIREGLTHAAELAIDIEDRTLESRDTTRRSDQLGRVLATVGFRAAALHDGVDRQYGNETEVQHASWLSARAASQRALNLSDTIGTRLTIAQLPDDQSPLRRYANDNPWLVPMPAYGVLIDELNAGMAAARKRDDATKMLFG